MDRQPTRSNRVVPDRRFDKTQLRASGHGRTVHRDYGAHVLRWRNTAQLLAEMNGEEPLDADDYVKQVFLKWGWIAREVKQHMRILDVGCGQDQPLLYILGSRMNTVPDLYVGVDLNKIAKKSGVKWSRIIDEFDFVTDGQSLIGEFGQFDVATNFEVIEHMGVEDGAKLLLMFYDALKPGGALYLSTPVFDGQAAANHIHEYTVPELQGMIEGAGFVIERRHGTFASKPAIKRAMKERNDEAALEMYERLEGWFGGDVLSTIFAPLYPDASRNNMWVCRKPTADALQAAANIAAMEEEGDEIVLVDPAAE